MIRTVLAVFAFALVVCALIVFRPFSESQDVATTGAASDVEVTRAITPAEPVVAPATQAIQPQPQPQAPQPRRPETSDVTMDDMTASVLADLGFETETPEAPNVEEQQIETTAGILASIESVTGQQVELAPRQTLRTLVVTALREGQSDDYIDALVNEAAATGRVTVPEVMVTSDGRVDTAVLLENLVTHAIIASGGNVPVPDVDPTTNPGVEVRVVQRAQDAVQARFYTVQTGDSLGAIAVKFYGRVDLFDRIFEANRQTLSSPDLIRTGQRLVIPALDA